MSVDLTFQLMGQLKVIVAVIRYFFKPGAKRIEYNSPVLGYPSTESMIL